MKQSLSDRLIALSLLTAPIFGCARAPADPDPGWLRARFSLRSLLDVRDRVGRLPVRLSVVNLDLGDALGRLDRLLATTSDAATSETFHFLNSFANA